MSSGLTSEQLRRMEENRKKALAKLAEKSKHTVKIPSQSSGQQIQASANFNKIVSRSVHESSCANLKNSTNVPFISDSRKNLAQTDRDIARSDASIGTKQGNVVGSDMPTTSNKPYSTNHGTVSTNVSNQDRIEQNRLKALAKRAEKLNKSPGKSTTPGASGFTSPLKQSSSVKTANSSLIKSINKDSISVINNTSSKSASGNHCNNGNTFVSTNSSSRSSGLTGNHGDSSNSSSSQILPANFSTYNTSNIGSNSFKPQSSELVDKPQASWNAFDSLGKGKVKGRCVLVSRDRFGVESGYSAPLIQFYKTMNTKLYDAVSKKWSFRLTEYNHFINSVNSLKPSVDVEPLPKAILQAFEAQLRGGNPERTIPIADLSKVESSLVNSLMSFQREGVNFGVYKNGRVLIADDMGLGKTIQAICLACYYRLEWPLLVVVPSSVRFDWAQQIQRWVPSIDPQTIQVAVTGKDNCTSGLVNIISYDLMARKADTLKAKRFQVVIMDECHLLKNYKTARCKAAMPLLQTAKRVIMLSGTPALSRPSELYTQLSAICPFLLKYHDFGVRYCNGQQQPWGWDFSGSSNMEELQLLLEEKIMIRRLKKDVLSELPDKVRQMVQLDPSFIKVDKGLKNASKVIGKLKKSEERGALLDFFHKSGIAKIKAIKNYVIDLLEGERKFIIFAHHGDVLDEIEATVQSKIGSNYMRIDGKTSSEQRNIVCKKFQHSDAIRVAILSITAANAGLNLSAANLVVFAELFWNPGILVQAEDRAHRIGQQDSVSVHYLVATGTSDDHIWPMIQKKLDVLGKAGLTKDNFSAAETTQFLDPQQEEITKFLEESFSGDLEGLNDIETEVEQSEVKPTVSKQQSILKYTSPTKDTHDSNTNSESVQNNKKTKQKSLFQYYSPSKTGSNDADQGQGHTNERSERGQCEMKGEDENQFKDDDFDDEFLDDADWDVGVPPNKKLKT